MFGQTFDPHDLALIGLLVVLEGVLSIDNALVLGLLARKVPKSQQRRALTYGLVGAFVFRAIAIGLAAYLFRWRVVKLAGGAYLIYVAVKHFFFEHKDPHGEGLEIGPDGVPVLHARPRHEILEADFFRVSDDKCNLPDKTGILVHIREIIPEKRDQIRFRYPE